MERINNKNIHEKISKSNKSEFDLIIAIIGRGFADYVISAARDAGATGATIMYARGTNDVDKQVMGISLQPEKEVILILVKSDERRKIMQEISDKTSIMEDGRAICFSLPVNQVYGLKRVAMQKNDQIKKAKQLAKESKLANKQENTRKTSKQETKKEK